MLRLAVDEARVEILFEKVRASVGCVCVCVCVYHVEIGCGRMWCP